MSWLLAGSICTSVLAFQFGVLDGFARPKYLILAATALAAALLATARLATQRGGHWLGTPDLLVGGYVAWNLLAYILSDIGGASFHGERFQYQGFAAVLIYAAGYFAIRYATDRRLVGFAVVGAAAVAAPHGILQYLDADPFWDVLFRDRIFSTFGQPNALGAFLAMALPFSVLLAATSGRAIRLGASLAAAVIVVALALTMSRGAYIGIAVAAVATVALMASRLNWRRLLPSTAAGLVVAVLLAAAPLTGPAVASVIDRASTITAPLDSSNQKRVDLWVVGVAIVEDNPLVGIGHEAYPEAFPDYAAAELSAESRRRLAPFRPESPHNIFVATAVNAGLPAALLYAALFGWALWTAARRFIVANSLLGAAIFFSLVTHLVTGAFMTAEAAGSWTAWLLIGWLAATAPIVTHNQRQA